MQPKIKWKDGSRPKGINAEDAYTELGRIRSQHGGELTPAIVCKGAREKSSPIHPWFEWDNGKAATEYRLHQARVLVASIEIIQVKDAPGPVRAYEIVNVQSEDPDEPQKNARVYWTIEEIMADPDAREQLMERAAGQANAYRRKYAALGNFSRGFKAVFRSIDKLDSKAG